LLIVIIVLVTSPVWTHANAETMSRVSPIGNAPEGSALAGVVWTKIGSSSSNDPGWRASLSMLSLDKLVAGACGGVGGKRR
jgi:hypothetical protein